MIRLGVDTGGTFTDFVLQDEQGRLRVHKVLSTPDAPERAILQGMRELGFDSAGLQLVHGSTVATNAVLEGKGASTVYITNRGFADLLTIGRQQRAELYDLQPPPRPPILPSSHCLEVDARVDAQGELLQPLDDSDLAALVERVKALKPDAVAVNLLFSYLHPALEQKIGAAMPDGLFVALSSEVLPEIREYERGMATWLTAWVGPKVGGYLRRLQRDMPGASVSVMQSSGDTIAASQAASQAVRMLLSGPAGGLVAARQVGESAGLSQLLTFDMGGTSTDVALVEPRSRLTTEGKIGRYPVAVPMVDMHTIGAGGGSIAWLDAGGMLQVGPESAGADPGPACYGRGGRHATVTDANLVLGRLRAGSFLGGGMQLDEQAAAAALRRLGDAMSVSVEQAALDVIAVANEHMAQALRAISIKRGVDPAEQVLMSFGGAGGLHVCALAEQLQMSLAIVPVHGGVLSALGMLAARPGRQLSRTCIGRLDAFSDDQIESLLAQLATQGMEALHEEGYAASGCDCVGSVDLRYLGQSYTLNLPWRGILRSTKDFHAAHETRYGHRLALPVELVNLRQAVNGPCSDMQLPSIESSAAARPFAEQSAYGVRGPVPCYSRDQLARGQSIDGPALIVEQVATTWVDAGWQLQVDDSGNLQLKRQPAALGSQR